MTNEEIIKTASATFFNDSVPNTSLPKGIGRLISDVLKLKDKQFKEYLEKKKAEIGLNMGNPPVGSSAFIAKDCMLLLINEIINELFGE